MMARMCEYYEMRSEMVAILFSRIYRILIVFLLLFRIEKEPSSVLDSRQHHFCRNFQRFLDRLRKKIQ